MHKQQMTSLKTHSEARPLGPGPFNSAKLGPSVKVLSANFGEDSWDPRFGKGPISFLECKS